MIDMMLDLETLGTYHDSVIIQIGAVVFDNETGKVIQKFYSNITIDSCLNRGLTVTGGTILFWISQNKRTQKTLLDPKPRFLVNVLVDFKDFYSRHEVNHVWCNTNFDAPIIENAFRACGVDYPIRYNKYRELRTIIDLANIDLSEYTSENHHNALNDCLFQIKYLVDGLSKIKEAVTLYDQSVFGLTKDKKE